MKKKLFFRPGEAEPLRMTGQAPRGWGIVVSPDGVGSEGLSFGMQDVDVGSAIPYHVHDKEEEILFFWRGQGKCVVEGEEFEITPGSTAYFPIGVWHGIVNTGDEPLRLTWCFSPPGYEKEFRRMSETGKDHEAPPPEKAV
jgi:mannose-6-phosphate isomerase-like protein (cupin superfamily)